MARYNNYNLYDNLNKILITYGESVTETNTVQFVLSRSYEVSVTETNRVHFVLSRSWSMDIYMINIQTNIHRSCDMKVSCCTVIYNYKNKIFFQKFSAYTGNSFFERPCMHMRQAIRMAT